MGKYITENLKEEDIMQNKEFQKWLNSKEYNNVMENLDKFKKNRIKKQPCFESSGIKDSELNFTKEEFLNHKI